MHTTGYPDVDKVLGLLSSDLPGILGKKLIALYLTGSLSYGDFNYGSSDIDFLAVLTGELTRGELDRVAHMHARIAGDVPYWARRLEGSYIPRAWLASRERPLGARPYINGGAMHEFEYGNEWLINAYALHERGIALVGPEPKALIQPVRIEDVREASRRDLLEEWEPKTREPEPFTRPDYDSSHLQAYAVLTLCRILHRAKVDAVASKRVAAAWVRENFSQWSSLIDAAERWQHGTNLDRAEDAKAFVRFVVGEIDPPADTTP